LVADGRTALPPVLLPVITTLFVWWFSTGVILYLDGLPPRTFRWSFLGASIAFGLALCALVGIGARTTPAAAYAGFASGIVCWGWVEIGFLMGFVTGPRRSACPAGSRGWRRARHAFEAILHHELALLAVALALAGISRGAANQTALGTFLLLWLMRLSAKLNVFLGVRNLGEEFLPEHLRYLHSYLSRRAMNWLFPFAVAAAIAGAVTLWRSALATSNSTYITTDRALLATLLSLAILEHVMLVIPIPTTGLWSWGFSARHGRPATALPGK